MKIGGLVTVTDATEADESASKTLILANHGGHEAAFIVHKDNIVDLASTPEFKQVFDYAGTATDYYAYKLDGIQVEFADDGNGWDGGPPVQFSDDGDANNATLPAIGTNSKSLHWIPHMKFVLGTTPVTNRDYYKKEPAATKVAARVPLRGGKLESVLKPPYYLWQFRDNTGSYKQVQVLAEELHYKFDLKPGISEFKVYGRKFGVSGTAPLFTIKTASTVAQAISIQLVNLPRAEFKPKPHKWVVGDQDKHFAMHCDTLTNCPGNRHVPTVIGQMESGAGAASIEVYCGPDQVP